MSRVAVHVSLATAVGILLLVAPVAAQSPGAESPPPSCDPTATACASPSASPASGIVWPPLAFAGGDPEVMVFTSTCGVWGRDPITLNGQGPDGSTAVMILELTDYDTDDFRWSGRVTGTHTAPNGYASSIDEPASVSYDLGTGEWVLQAFWAQHVLATDCAPSSPPPA